MSMSSFTGVSPRLSSHVLLAASVLFAFPISSADAEPRRVNFSGQLDYGTFRAAAQRGQAVTIKYSPGGTGAAALALARVPNVVIDGRCNSACAWSFVRNSNACFTARASFGFHAAHDPGTGRRLNAATGYWLKSVRPSLRGKLGALLGTSSLIRVSAAEMRRHYADRACGAAPKTEVATLKSKQVVASARPDGAESIIKVGKKPGKGKGRAVPTVACVDVLLANGTATWSVAAVFKLARWEAGLASDAVTGVGHLERLRQETGTGRAGEGLASAPDDTIALARASRMSLPLVWADAVFTQVGVASLSGRDGDIAGVSDAPEARHAAALAPATQSSATGYSAETWLAVDVLFAYREVGSRLDQASVAEGAAATFLVLGATRALNG